MNKVILQPTSNKDAQKHFNDTIIDHIGIDTIKRHIKDPQILSTVIKDYPDNKINIWGITNGENNSNKKKWERISRGDITLFSKKGGVFAKAVTTIKFNSFDLAYELWGLDDNGNTWENIYLVQDIEMINIPYEKLNPILEYKDNYVIQGIVVLNEEKSLRVIAELDLFNDKTNDEVSEKDFTSIVKELEGQEGLDAEVITKRRKEQAFLRDYLFKDKPICPYGICQREFSIDMLVAAHIKKRSLSTEEERLDYKNIIMPMCKFGCDDLYEKGYIYVNEQGYIAQNERKNTTSTISNYIENIINKKCTYYNEDSKKYFQAHLERHSIKV